MAPRKSSDRRADIMEKDIVDLKLAQERIDTIATLNEFFKPLGAEVLSYMGPAKYSLMCHIHCESCGEMGAPLQQAYDIRMLSTTWPN